MNPIRKKKLETSILRELAQLIIRQQNKDDRIEFVTVQAIELRKDFSSAKVHLSFFGTEDSKHQCYKAILANLNYFQSTIGRNLRLRYTPRLTLCIVENLDILNDNENINKLNDLQNLHDNKKQKL